MSKNMKQTKRETLTDRMVTTFGNIELDKDEKAFLALGPDFAIFDDLKMEKIEKEIQITATKVRWAISKGPPSNKKLTNKTNMERREFGSNNRLQISQDQQRE